jgi:hypothetical protein
MTKAQRRSLDRQIVETIETLNTLRHALQSARTYEAEANDDLWSKCLGKVGRLQRDLVRLEKRTAE